MASFGPTPLTVTRRSKRALFFGTREAEEQQRVFAHDLAHEQEDFARGRRELGRGEARDAHEVADAAGLDDRVAGAPIGERAAQRGDHRAPPPFEQLFQCASRRTDRALRDP